MPRLDMALVIALGAILAIPAIGYVAWSRRQVAEPGALLESAAGVVEIRRGTGAWRTALPGQRVAPGDELRVGGGGAARLVSAGRFDLSLTSATRVRLGRDTHLELAAGAVEVGVPAGSSFTVAGLDGAVAEASGRDARFRVAAGPRGLEVHAQEGAVRLRAGGSVRELAPGEHATSPPPGADP